VKIIPNKRWSLIGWFNIFGLRIYKNWVLGKFHIAVRTLKTKKWVIDAREIKDFAKLAKYNETEQDERFMRVIAP
jgi:hypothetical protein